MTCSTFPLREMEIVVTCSTFPFCLYLSCGGVCLKLSVILSFCHILINLCSVRMQKLFIFEYSMEKNIFEKNACLVLLHGGSSACLITLVFLFSGSNILQFSSLPKW